MRYSRQNQLTVIPNNFQTSIINKNLIIIGCGGIGSILAQMLIRGGFETLTLIDNDLIDESNLQRQLYFENDIGKSKSKTLAKYLKKINKSATIRYYETFINDNNINNLCQNSDLIIDCSDNIKTRRIINNYCLTNKKDWIYNGAVKTEFIVCPILRNTDTFDKIFANTEFDEKCSLSGVLSSSVFCCASFSYALIIKYFTNDKLKMIKCDIYSNKFYEVDI